VHASVFIADGARVIGSVRIAEDASIWFNAVLRADINSITVGPRSNIQDGAVVHVTHDLPAVIGADVTVGHQAIVHACTVEDGCLIGMGSVVLDGAVVGTGSLVAAGAVVLQNTRIPPGSLAAGVPARVIRQLGDEERRQLRQSAIDYAGYARRFTA
jgi:carbonic anhydrase/acetyltransferase-like protein (isoleucine patch superfamily)